MKKGFTLIELFVVAAIIAILGAFLLASIGVVVFHERSPHVSRR